MPKQQSLPFLQPKSGQILDVKKGKEKEDTGRGEGLILLEVSSHNYFCSHGTFVSSLKENAKWILTKPKVTTMVCVVFHLKRYHVISQRFQQINFLCTGHGFHQQTPRQPR